MATVLGVALDDVTRSALAADASLIGDVLHETDPAEALRTLEDPDANDVEVVVLGPNLDEPVRTAQRIYVVAPHVPVLILLEHDRHQDVCRAVDFAPYLPEHLECVDVDEPAATRGALTELVDRVRRTRAHRSTIDALNARLAAAPSLTAPPAVLGGILDNAPIGVAVLDAQGHVRGWNRRCGEILGRTERAALGSRFEDLLPTAERSRWTELARPVLDGRRAALREVFRGKIGGEERHVEITASRLAGRERSTLLILQDVTERAELVDRLRDAVRARDEFLSIASHELRTPLTSIQLLVQRLARTADDVDAAKVKERALSIERGVARLAALVETLLDVSRIHQRRLDLHREHVDLGALVHEVVDRYRVDSERARCTIVVEVDASAGVGRWDRVRIEQVLSNLLSNAVKYAPGTSITVVAEGDASTARLRVRDRGIGIAEDVQGRIFERFERAVSSRHYGGLGLGLFIAREIVEAHGGQIRVESRPGAGAEFTVELPRDGGT